MTTTNSTRERNRTGARPVRGSKDNERENSQRRHHNYKIGDKVLLKKDHLKITCKTEFRNEVLFTIVRTHKNGTLTITDENSGVTTTLNMRRLCPFYA